MNLLAAQSLNFLFNIHIATQHIRDAAVAHFLENIQVCHNVDRGLLVDTVQDLVQYGAPQSHLIMEHVEFPLPDEFQWYALGNTQPAYCHTHPLVVGDSAGIPLSDWTFNVPPNFLSDQVA